MCRVLRSVLILSFVTLTAGGLLATQYPSSTALSSTPNPSSYGTLVSIKATITPNTTTGSVTFYDGGNAIAGGTVSAGMATMSTSTLTAGSHSLTATYGGNPMLLPSTSGVDTQTVNKASSSISVRSSSNPSIYGSSVTFTATVTPTSATGTVTFYDNGGQIGTGSLSSGTATFSTSPLLVGSHPITASYGGNSNYNGSTSTSLTQTVNQASPSISLNCSPSSVTFGGQTTCTATVPSADGTVTFYSPTTLTGQWWNGTSGSWYPSGGGNLAGTPVAITHDGSLNYDITGYPWPGATAAPANVNSTYIYARWTGTFVSTIAGAYTIGVNSDDGANVYINGTELVGNLGTGQGAAANLTYTQSGTISLTASAVNTVVVENQQTQGGAGIQLLWTPPGASSPSLLGWSVVPVNASKQAAITGNILAPGSSAVSAVWSGDTSYTSGSASSTVTATASTATELNSSLNPSVYGQNVTFSSLIDTGGGGPTGNVTFSNGGTNIGSGAASLVSRRTSFPTRSSSRIIPGGDIAAP